MKTANKIYIYIFIKNKGNVSNATLTKTTDKCFLIALLLYHFAHTLSTTFLRKIKEE